MTLSPRTLLKDSTGIGLGIGRAEIMIDENMVETVAEELAGFAGKLEQFMYDDLDENGCLDRTYEHYMGKSRKLLQQINARGWKFNGRIAVVEAKSYDENMTEAVAEAWASIDGKLERFRDDKAGKLGDMDGTYQGYMAEASELLRRIEGRGWVLVGAAKALDTEKEVGGGYEI